MKKLLILSTLALLLPSLLSAQTSIKSLMESYSEDPTAQYIEANKAIIWMVKAKSPKGAMDGIKQLYILNFDAENGKASYEKFRSDALSALSESGAECVKDEATKEGSVELYMERKEKPTEMVMFMHDKKGSEGILLMVGEFASSLEIK